MENKQTVKKVIFGIFILAVMAAALFWYSRLLNNELSNEIQSTLREVSVQSALSLQKEIEKEQNILIETAAGTKAEDLADLDALLRRLAEITSRHKFKRMGVILPDGASYTSDRANVDFRDREYFKQSLKGQNVVSDPMIDRIDGEEIIVFSTPVYKRNQVCAVMFATYSLDEIRKILSVSIFGGEGYCYVARSDGTIVGNSGDWNARQRWTNFFSLMGETAPGNERCIDLLRRSLESGKSGYIRFTSDTYKHLYYLPLGVNDWYLIEVAPLGAVNGRLEFIMDRTYMLCVLLTVLFMVFFLYHVRLEKQKDQELEHILYMDEVTGGWSYAKFRIEARKSLDHEPGAAAFLTMDIDGFKVINELYGNDEGDRTLQFIWRMWRESVREGELFARRMADRFDALLYFKSFQELEERVRKFCERLQEATQADASAQGSGYILKPVLGIYAVEDKREPIQLMQNYASMAWSAAKGRSDTFYAFYDDMLRKNLLNRKVLEDRMEYAYRKQQFTVFYQPKYGAVTRQVVGAEALVRWKEKDGTMVMPSEFIPLAEKTGFINKLDRYVYEQVCAMLKEMTAKGGEPMPVSVNLSRQLLYNPDFINEYEEIRRKYGVPAQSLQLEITESAVFENQTMFCEIVDRLRALGYLILMDDFGTGYSSLMMLKQIPIDILKLDKSFVDDYDDSRGRIILESAIKLAQSLKIKVIAEGVETRAQYEFLRDLGCDEIQGYYFSRPMTKTDFFACAESCRSGAMAEGEA